MPTIEDATRLFLGLLAEGRDRDADDMTYNIVSLARGRTPEFVLDHLLSRTTDAIRPETEAAFLSLALLMSFVEGDRKSQGLAVQYYLGLLPSMDTVISGRAHFHLAEMMLKDPNPSPLLRSRIEQSLQRAVELRHAEATMLLGTLYSHGTLADDGEPEPHKGAALIVRAIEERRVSAAKPLLLAIMERHDLRVDGYDIDGLRADAGIH
jgi:TPR repeat protein